MSSRFATRRWATQLTLGSFGLMSMTGVLMFFDREPGLMTVVHQWCSWLFLLGAGGHIALHSRSFLNHARSAPGRASLIGFAGITVASAFSWGLITGPQLERPIEAALVDAPLSALAGIVRVDPDTLVQRLGERGIAAAATQSIRTLADRAGVDENRLLALVFLPN